MIIACSLTNYTSRRRTQGNPSLKLSPTADIDSSFYRSKLLPYTPFLSHDHRLQSLATNSASGSQMAPYTLAYRPISHEPPDGENESTNSDIDPSEEKLTDSGAKRVPSWRLRRPLLCHGAILLLYTLIFIFATLGLRRPLNQAPSLIFSPARSSLRYESRVFEIKRNEDQMAPYFGKPNADLDLAWHRLLQYQNIHISLAELRHFEGREDEAVAYPDGSGYMAQLQVYHDLHCLKRIHHTMWPEYYYPNLTQLELEELKFHNDHCLDTLRQSIMCHADISLITMRWGHLQPIPLGNFSAPHECIDWGALDGWSQSRSVDVMRPGWLKHPVLGASFPTGKGVRTGVGHDN